MDSLTVHWLTGAFTSWLIVDETAGVKVWIDCKSFNHQIDLHNVSVAYVISKCKQKIWIYKHWLIRLLEIVTFRSIVLKTQQSCLIVYQAYCLIAIKLLNLSKANPNDLLQISEHIWRLKMMLAYLLKSTRFFIRNQFIRN